ncbi:hypothetical protein FOZ62_007844 [Perkinsus olseni]|uniref:Uncharacterized protein n=2 Tax=Perkinsus olseni TaxID=32597 RepID=A0A7J6T6I9_PEROL|nr:hypothetical protein FOZ62_007844 [Perkinsus olseni]
MPQSATSPAPAGGAVMLGGSAGKGGPSASHQWQQHIQGRPYSQAQPQQTAPSHAPRYSVPQQQQQASGMQQTQTPPKPLTVANPAAGAMVVQSTPRPKQGLSRPGQGVARSGSRYDQRQRMGKGGKGAATTPVLPTQVTPRANPVAPQPAQRVTPPPRPAVLPERTMPQVTAVVQSSGATPSMPPAATVVGCRDRTPVRPMPKAALQTAAAPPASSTNSAPPPPRSHMAMVTPTVVQSGIAISDTRKTAAANSTGPKYSELMASVLPPLRPGEAEFVLEMWTDKRARFPLRSTVLSSRWQSSPEHTCRHRMQIFPRGYQLRDLPASQRKPTDSWLAVNVVVENEPKPQSPFVGAAYPWAAQSLNKQVMLWIPNYKSPSTSIIRYGPGVFSKEQPTLGWSGLLDLQSDPAKLIDAGWIDNSGKLVIRSMVVDTEKEVVVKVAFTSSWLKTKQEVADAQAKLKVQQQLEVDREAEAARQAARRQALASSGPSPTLSSTAASEGSTPAVAAAAQQGTPQGPQGRKWIAPAFPDQTEKQKVEDAKVGDVPEGAAADEPTQAQHTPSRLVQPDRSVQELRRSSAHRGRRGGRNRNGKQEVITVVTHKPGQEKEMIGENAVTEPGSRPTGELAEGGWTDGTAGEEKKRKSTDDELAATAPLRPQPEQQAPPDEPAERAEASRVSRGPSTYDARPPSKKARNSVVSQQPLEATPRANVQGPAASMDIQVFDSRKGSGAKVKRESWEEYSSSREGRASEKSRRWSEGWEESWEAWDRADWEESGRPEPGEKWVDAWNREEAGSESPGWRSTYRASAAEEWTKYEVPKDSWEEKDDASALPAPEPREMIRDMRNPPASFPGVSRESLPSGNQQSSRYMMKEEAGTFAVYGATSGRSESTFPPVRDWRRPASRSRDACQDNLKPLVQTGSHQPQEISTADRPAVLLRPRSGAAPEPSIIDERPPPVPLPQRKPQPQRQQPRVGNSSNHHPPRPRSFPSKQRRPSDATPSGHMVYDRPAGHDMAYYQRQAARR